MYIRVLADTEYCEFYWKTTIESQFNGSACEWTLLPPCVSSGGWSSAWAETKWRSCRESVATVTGKPVVMNRRESTPVTSANSVTGYETITWPTRTPSAFSTSSWKWVSLRCDWRWRVHHQSTGGVWTWRVKCRFYMFGSIHFDVGFA